MPIHGVAAALPGGQDLYQGLQTKNKSDEEFSLNAKAQHTGTAVATVETKKTFWDQFSNQVNKAADATNQTSTGKTYEERLADIKTKGNLILHHPLPNLVKDYLSDVKSLLNDARKNGYNGKHEDGVFKKLDLADEKLIKLTDAMLAEQKPEIDLVASLGELQGLLVDIFV